MAPEANQVVGRRTAAGFIDVILLAALFVGLAALFGDIHDHDSSFSVSLNGGPAFLYFALVYGYYFMTEAFLGGRTLGKALLGLRVVQTDGSPPRVGQIAGRTALRVVDGMPVLYLVGFICVLATGRKAQRIGDMAAQTTVVGA
ncbi:MAG: putative rane protein/domain [Solirubrobacteraceae bacterium]|nr:putative rane protein/domain [Solirubrobacteraceae bacterium]